MRAVWIGVYNRGEIASERVHFRATNDINLVRYVLFDTLRINDNALANGNRGSFWFSSLEIRTGENVVVYTRAGQYSREVKPDGSVYHFIFRGLTTPLYAFPASCAVLLELGDWQTVF
jgi:hypothetical protein